MKKIMIYFFAGISLFFLPFVCFAQDYDAENARIESTKSFSSKAILMLQFAQKRIDMIKTLNAPDKITALAKEYADYINKAVAYLDTAVQNNESIASALEIMQPSIAQHITALNTAAKQVAYPAQEKVYNAVNAAKSASSRVGRLIEKQAELTATQEKQEQAERNRFRHRGRR